MRATALLLILLAAFLVLVGCASSGGSGANGDDDTTPDDDTAVDDDTTPDDDTVADDDTNDQVEVFLDGDTVVLRNHELSVRYDLTPGRFHILDADGKKIVRNAEALVLSHELIPAHKWHGSALPLIDWTQADASNALGAGKSITVRRGGTADAPNIAQTFTLLAGESCLLAAAKVDNATRGSLKIGAIYPLYANPPDGALLFGRSADLRTLTNGTLNYADFVEPLNPGFIPSDSNWSTLIFNQRTGRSLALGFLTYELAQPVVYNGPDRGSDASQSLQADCQYDPAQTLTAGGSLTSEQMILDFEQATPFDALELYADRLKTWLNISLWVERHPEIGVPAGWNSWSGSDSSGGYGHGINEQIITDNMDFADRELRRWGFNYFQIDDGWEVRSGDWQVDTTKFPDHGAENGIAWLMDRAKSLGFHTGLWCGAFSADGNAQTVQDHPDWFGYQILHQLTGASGRYLDLSNPDALAYLTDLINTLKDWGIQWLKLDFAYDDMLSEGWHDPTLTRGEFYRRGIQTIRDALGPDAFFLNVAVAGFNYGMIDSLRLTLDTMPVWEGTATDPYSLIAMFDNQGLKPMYRDAARRYYLNGRVWINHPDLIFFRAHSDPKYPPLTLNETQTFATAVVLQGGLVKLGDRLVDLSADALNTIRAMLPVWGHAGRPLDLFRRTFPEVWALHMDDFDEPYAVIGLLNWGINQDLTTPGYDFLPDAARDISATFAEAGLDEGQTYLAFEFWTQQFLGEVTGELSLNVPARTPRVVALRPKLDRPQLLGTNRHLLGGVGVIRSLKWDAAGKTLTGVQEGAVGTTFAPFTHQITLYAPDGFTASTADVTAPSGYQIANKTLTTNGKVVTLRFDVVRTGAPQTADQHPDVTWVVNFE
jgi:hypothetical protein